MLSTTWAQTRNETRDDAIDDVIAQTRDALRRRQAADGHWVYELEADATIPSEFIMLGHYLGEIEPELEQKIARYLRNGQGRHGGWPLFYEGDLDISATVKAYFALKLVGDDPDAPHMRRPAPRTRRTGVPAPATSSRVSPWPCSA